ncbi:unnamed protein product, partial [Ectocarpus sp. 12 AP-2014]
RDEGVQSSTIGRKIKRHETRRLRVGPDFLSPTSCSTVQTIPHSIFSLTEKDGWRLPQKTPLPRTIYHLHRAPCFTCEPSLACVHPLVHLFHHLPRLVQSQPNPAVPQTSPPSHPVSRLMCWPRPKVRWSGVHQITTAC